MKRLATLFMVICFAATFLSNSMFMLSIERGKVYTESFSLNHILKTAYSSQTKNSQDTLPSLESCRIFCHRHIILTRCAIHEESFAPADADRYPGVDLLPPTYTAFFNSLTTISSKKQLDYSSRLKLPIPPLLQTTILLI